MYEYPNLLRLRFDHITIRSDKRYLTPEKEKELFKNPVIIQEKLDGSQSAIAWRGGQPYAQGRASHIEQSDKRVAYDGLWSWLWQNLDKLEATKGYIVFGEWLRPQHSIDYNELPSFFMAFDAFDVKLKRYIGLKQFEELMANSGMSSVQTLFQGVVKKRNEILKLVDGKSSAYSSYQNMEGCVIKNYDRQVFAKYVSREYLEDMFDSTGHWTGRRTVRYNRLTEWKKDAEKDKS